MRKMMLAMLVMATAGCGGEAAKPAAADNPKTPVAGEYEVTSEVTMLASADRTTPATSLKKGDKATMRACIAADGTPDPAMFIEQGDSCTATSTYFRSGRISVQYSCNRPGKGEVFPNADGNYTADGFKAVVVVASGFAGDGDYKMTRMLDAKRVGNCPSATKQG